MFRGPGFESRSGHYIFSSPVTNLSTNLITHGGGIRVSYVFECKDIEKGGRNVAVLEWIDHQGPGSSAIEHLASGPGSNP